MMKTYVGVPWKTPPEWFLKEIVMIDPTYYVVYNDEFDYYQVMKEIRVFDVGPDGKMEKQDRTSALATFRYANDRALDDLRRRKKFSLQFNRASTEDDDNAYLNWIAEQNRENNAKAREYSIEMRAEGYMKMHKARTSATFNMPGGKDGPSGTQDGRP
jgi:hypothetical protein